MSSPDHVLDIYVGSHATMNDRILARVERVLLQGEPNAVLVYADANSSLAGALAADKLHVSVAKMEDGLRSLNIEMPEEINRTLTDRISSGILSSTCVGAHHQRRLGFSLQQIFPVDDIIRNVALHFGPQVQTSNGVMARPGAAT